MMYSKSIIVELYAVIYKANGSFQTLNRAIRKYNYEIDILPLCEFERKFRQLFNLVAYDENRHKQNCPVTYKNEQGEQSNFFISEEFYKILAAYYTEKNPFFENGYVTVLKTKKILHKEPKSELLDIGIVIQDLEKIKKFTEKLESCLRVARYGFIEFHSHFAMIADEQRLIPLIRSRDLVLFDNTKNFIEKDNALISALLNINYKITDYIQLAIKAFEESFHIKNIQVRFIHLLSCLEICFNTSTAEAAAPVIARYSSILIAVNKRDFLSLYTELINMFRLKKKIMTGGQTNEYGTNENNAFNDKVIFLEEISRNVIKKLLYLNIKSKEELFYKLDLKTLPGSLIYHHPFPPASTKS